MKSKQWENAQYNENSLLFNTYSRSQKQRQHTQPESLKLSNQNLKSQQEKKKSFKKDNCSAFLGRYSPMGEVLTPSQSYRWFLLHTAGRARWLALPRNNCMSRTLSVRQDPRSSFFLFSFFTKILSTEFQTKMYCI